MRGTLIAHTTALALRCRITTTGFTLSFFLVQCRLASRESEPHYICAVTRYGLSYRTRNPYVGFL